jgi:hypothetical protein
MQLNPQNVLSPAIVGNGFTITVSGGSVYINSSTLVLVPTTVVNLTANSVNYVYFNILSGFISVNTTGFPSDVYQIATATTDGTGIRSLVDSRPDLFLSSSGGVSGRLVVSGTPLATNASQFTLVGWGAGVTKAVTGFDGGHRLTITCGTTPSVSPTFALTFVDGPFTNAPLITGQKTSGTGSWSDLKVVSTTTGYTATFEDLPVATKTYEFTILNIGI